MSSSSASVSVRFDLTADLTAEAGGHADLVAHLVHTTGLTPGQARRLVADVLEYFGETTESYVRRRHRELKSGGMYNEQILPRLGAELAQRRVRPAPLSERQLRRIVYG